MGNKSQGAKSELEVRHLTAAPGVGVHRHRPSPQQAGAHPRAGVIFQ
jgi:hypothetical protein